MKKRHYLFTAIFSYLILLIATIPARPVTEMISDNSPITIQGVSGTIWHGKAYIVTVNDVQLKKTEWSFKLWKLFTGKLAIELDTFYLDNKVSTELGSSFTGRFFVNELSAKIAAQEIANIANIPMAQLDGSIHIDIEHAQWKQGEPPLASGEIKWINATVTVAETASLGNVNIVLSESDQQLLNAEISNQGGDINISGHAELVPDTNYTVDIKLVPTSSASNNLKQSLGFFAQKQPGGEYLLKKSGSLDQIM